MAAISNDWLAPLQGEFKKPYYKKLYETVKHEYQTRKIFRRRMIFQCLCLYTTGKGKSSDLGSGSLSQQWPGPWPEFFRKAGYRYSAIFGEYLSGAA